MNTRKDVYEQSTNEKVVIERIQPLPTLNFYDVQP